MNPAAKISDLGKFTLNCKQPFLSLAVNDLSLRSIPFEADIPDSTLECERSRRGDAQSFPEELLDDPYHQDTSTQGFRQVG